MTDAGDIARMRRIGQRMESWGVEVRWMPGWEERGATWDRVPVGVIDHHDAAGLNSGEWGALTYIVNNGLAQFQVARCLDGKPRVAICAAGRQAHAGVGSWVFPDGVAVPTNQGNAYLYGVEKANNGLGEKYNDAAIYAADACFRAILKECGNLPAHRVVGHKEYGNRAPGGYPGRKTDPTYDMNWRRNRVANFITEGDDMPTAQEIAQAVLNEPIDNAWRQGHGEPIERPDPSAKTSLRAQMSWLDNQVVQLQNRLGRIDDKVGQGGGGAGVDVDDLKSFITAEINRAFVEFRERVAEGYDVKLDPKNGGTPDPQ